jgi:hypothetical protein
MCASAKAQKRVKQDVAVFVMMVFMADPLG